MQLPVPVRLEAGETILWTGKPDPWQAARKGGASACLGLLIVAFGVFLLYAGGFFAGVFVLAVGLLVSGVPYFQYHLALTTTYAVSNRRLMILRQKYPMESFPQIRKSDVNFLERGDDRGDIFFAWRSTGFGARRKTERVGFEGISNVRQAYAVIVKAVDALDSPAQPSVSPKPRYRWSGIVGDAPREVTPSLLSIEQTGSAMSLPEFEGEAILRTIQRGDDLATVLDSAGVPQGVRTGLTWGAAALMLFFGLPMFF